MPEGPTCAMARMWTSTPLFGLVESCWKYQVGWWYLRLMWHIGIYDARRARRRHGRYEFFYTMIIIDFYLSLKSLTVWITRAQLLKKQENLIFLGRLERYPKPTDNQLRNFFPSPLGLRVFFGGSGHAEGHLRTKIFRSTIFSQMIIISPLLQDVPYSQI